MPNTIESHLKQLPVFNETRGAQMRERLNKYRCTCRCRRMTIPSILHV
jgi:hypothetical protein